MGNIVESHIRDGVISVTILQGTSSVNVDVGFRRLAWIQMPAVWTTASITFRASGDNVTFQDVYNNAGTEYSVTASTSRTIIMTYADFIGFRFLTIRSGTTGTPVVQAQNSILVLGLAA